MKLLKPLLVNVLIAGVILLVSTWAVVATNADEQKKSDTESSKDNPLRLAPSTDTGDEKSNSPSSDSKNKQMIRGKVERTSPGSIDLIILNPADAETKADATDNTVDAKQASAGSNAKEGSSREQTGSAPATMANSPTTKAPAIGLVEEESFSAEQNANDSLAAEYETLHAGLSPGTKDKSLDLDDREVLSGSTDIVFGEDTDNPDFETKGKAVQEDHPAPIEDVLDTEAIAQLADNAIEFPEEDYPAEDTDASALPKSDRSTTNPKNTDDNEHADSDAPQIADEAPEKSHPADLVSRPTLRRPKPITIEPIAEDQLPSNPSPNTNGDRATASIKPKSDVVPTKQPPKQVALPVDPSTEQRRKRIDATLQHYLANPESATERSPWAVMHAILPFGADSQLIYRKQRVNAIAWMCANRVCKTQTILSPVGKSFRPNVGGGVQGHDGQFLAILAQTNVSSQYPLYVNQRKFTVADLVHYEMATCKPKTELTFKLIGLSYYLGTKQQWRSRDRQVWDVERLLAEELAQQVNGAACGGTHRLMGIHFAVKQRKEDGMPIDGKFAVAEKYIKDYIDYAWTLQNPDGSFSTNWFESRGMENNDERKVQTTGHILEWLIYASTPEDLKRRRVDAAIDFLVSRIYEKRNYKWPIGPRGHALRAIALYREKCLELEPLTLADVNVAQESSSQAKR